MRSSLGVVDDRVEYSSSMSHDPGEGVSFGEDDEGVEAGLFEAGRVEEGEIETRPDLVRENVGGGTDQLSLAFEALRREH